MTRNRFTKKNYRFVDYDVMSKIIGKKLKEVRLAKGFTINAVSNYSGVNRNTIRRLENGECENGVMLNNLLRIAVTLDISMSDLFFEVDYFCNYGCLQNGHDESFLYAKEGCRE